MAVLCDATLRVARNPKRQRQALRCPQYPETSGTHQKGFVLKRYAVVTEKTDTGYGAYVPDLPGCITTGSTLQETKQNIREAIELHLEAMREVGEPIPVPTSDVDFVELETIA